MFYFIQQFFAKKKKQQQHVIISGHLNMYQATRVETKIAWNVQVAIKIANCNSSLWWQKVKNKTGPK